MQNQIENLLAIDAQDQDHKTKKPVCHRLELLLMAIDVQNHNLQKINRPVCHRGVGHLSWWVDYWRQSNLEIVNESD